MNTSRSVIGASAILLGVVSLYAIAPLLARAQLSLPGIETALSIGLSPQYPSPRETVRLTVKSSVLDLSESTVVWRANGKSIAQGIGADSVEIVVGALGARSDVEVSVTTPSGVSASAQALIIPTELDLLMDSDSYAPPFYRGRGLVSAGTTIELSAIPRFKRAGGAFVASSDLIYTWRMNGEVQGAVSGRGKSNVRIPFQHLYGSDLISVEARTLDGILSGAARVVVRATPPFLALYEDHPLYGILYHRALGPSSFIPESEMTFAAVPYFAQAKHPDDPALVYDWRVNDTGVVKSGTAPDKITINAANSSGIALVELALTHATNFYTDMRGRWNITLSSSDVSAQDQFHGIAQ